MKCYAIAVACLLFAFVKCAPPSTYRAAVYEHALTLKTERATSREEAMEHMMENLNVFKTQAEIAGSKGVDILVFPEDGIYDFTRSREDIKHYLEYMPDPLTTSWTPCDDPTRYNRTDIQVFLSCLAKNNSLYLVANFGDVQQCESGDPNCPEDGEYQYNTNVAYDRKGTFIAKYHKQHLFFEKQFNEPVHPEFSYFDTEFGRVGMFTCFDMIFHDPAVPLVEKYNITDVAFPTAWMDALPYFSAIGFHSSFAVAHNVNFLSANLHIPTKRFQGSGIYTPTGANAFYYDKNSPDGKLIISDVSTARSPKASQRLVLPPAATMSPFIDSNVFQAPVFEDWYNFVSLGSDAGHVTVCQAGLCCYLAYDKKPTKERFVLGVFNGIHVHHGPYYLQVCILLKCKSRHPRSCGRLNFDSKTPFYSFHVSGNFSTPYVYPQVVQSEGGVLKLPDKDTWQFGTDGLRGSSVSTPLLSASLVGLHVLFFSYIYQGVDILVLPEYGILFSRDRKDIKHFLEYMPDPLTTSWTPCDDPTRYSRTDIQVFLSCLAKNNSLYLVANLGDVQQCKRVDPNCPKDGEYQYNTNVAYDRNGKFIAKYHKQHLYYETQFDEPVQPQYSFFDTEFGRFGMFTCFDIIFHDPAVTLVEKYNITDVVFPTAWMDSLPYFSAIGFHSSFAVTHNVNFLAANLHIPTKRFQGSGIYTPTGANAFYYDRQSSNGKLMISDVSTARRPKTSQPLVLPPAATMAPFIESNVSRSVLRRDWYNFVFLGKDAGHITVCQAGLCCYLSYDKVPTDERFAFGVFNGIHVKHGQYLQVCILLKCLSEDPLSCGRLNFNSTTSFYSFHVSGNFSTPYVYPQFLLSEGGVLKLPAKGTWQFGTDGVRGSSVSSPLLTASLLGRVFESDY